MSSKSTPRSNISGQTSSKSKVISNAKYDSQRVDASVLSTTSSRRSNAVEKRTESNVVKANFIKVSKIYQASKVHTSNNKPAWNSTTSVPHLTVFSSPRSYTAKKTQKKEVGNKLSQGDSRSENMGKSNIGKTVPYITTPKSSIESNKTADRTRSSHPAEGKKSSKSKNSRTLTQSQTNDDSELETDAVPKYSNLEPSTFSSTGTSTPSYESDVNATRTTTSGIPFNNSSQNKETSHRSDYRNLIPKIILTTSAANSEKSSDSEIFEKSDTVKTDDYDESFIVSNKIKPTAPNEQSLESSSSGEDLFFPEKNQRSIAQGRQILKQPISYDHSENDSRSSSFGIGDSKKLLVNFITNGEDSDPSGKSDDQSDGKDFMTTRKNTKHEISRKPTKESEKISSPRENSKKTVNFLEPKKANSAESNLPILEYEKQIAADEIEKEFDSYRDNSDSSPSKKVQKIDKLVLSESTNSEDDDWYDDNKFRWLKSSIAINKLRRRKVAEPELDQDGLEQDTMSSREDSNISEVMPSDENTSTSEKSIERITNLSDRTVDETKLNKSTYSPRTSRKTRSSSSKQPAEEETDEIPVNNNNNSGYLRETRSCTPRLSTEARKCSNEEDKTDDENSFDDKQQRYLPVPRSNNKAINSNQAATEETTVNKTKSSFSRLPRTSRKLSEFERSSNQPARKKANDETLLNNDKPRTSSKPRFSAVSRCSNQPAKDESDDGAAMNNKSCSLRRSNNPRLSTESKSSNQSTNDETSSNNDKASYLPVAIRSSKARLSAESRKCSNPLSDNKSGYSRAPAISRKLTLSNEPTEEETNDETSSNNNESCYSPVPCTTRNVLLPSRNSNQPTKEESNDETSSNNNESSDSPITRTNSKSRLKAESTNSDQSTKEEANDETSSNNPLPKTCSKILKEELSEVQTRPSSTNKHICGCSCNVSKNGKQDCVVSAEQRPAVSKAQKNYGDHDSFPESEAEEDVLLSGDDDESVYESFDDTELESEADFENASNLPSSNKQYMYDVINRLKNKGCKCNSLAKLGEIPRVTRRRKTYY